MHVISRPSANAADPFEATRLHGCNVQGCKAQVAGCRLRLQANVTRRLQDGGVHGSRRRLMDARLQAARRKAGGSRWLQHARLRRTGCRLQSCKLQSCKGTGSKVAGSHNSLPKSTPRLQNSLHMPDSADYNTHHVVRLSVCEVVEACMGTHLPVVDISPQGGFRVQVNRSGFFNFVYNPDLQKMVAPAVPWGYVSHVVVKVLFIRDLSCRGHTTRQHKRHEPIRTAR